MIWDFRNILTRRLLIAAGVSIAVGLGMLLFGEAFWKALGLQLAAWGAIEGWLSWFWLRRTQNHLGHRSSFSEEEQEAGRMRRLLWITNGLCVILTAGGVALVFLIKGDALFWQGTGWSFIVQGVFLYLFSMQHALHVPDPLQLPHLPLFTHPDHEPFLFTAGEPAALLVHGFPGTALEMRPLGKALSDAGWTARGMRLPGFGPELAEVINYSNEAWVSSILTELHTLRHAGHSPLLLIGYSFGGGLAVQAAAREPVDGLVLIAPITWREPAWAKFLMDFSRSVLPLSIHPFRRIPLNTPRLADEFEKFLPEIDLKNPEHLSELTHLQMPLYIFDQIRNVGREALAAAPYVHTPTLLIQGLQDKVIQSSRTAHLRDQFLGDVTYETVSGSHHMTMPHHPAFSDVVEKVLSFAAQIQSSSKGTTKH